jgi:hypothetical protein
LIVDDRLNPGCLAFTDLAGNEMTKTLLAGKVAVVAPAGSGKRAGDFGTSHRSKWLDTAVSKAASGVFF